MGLHTFQRDWCHRLLQLGQIALWIRVGRRLIGALVFLANDHWARPPIDLRRWCSSTRRWRGLHILDVAPGALLVAGILRWSCARSC